MAARTKWVLVTIAAVCWACSDARPVVSVSLEHADAYAQRAEDASGGKRGLRMAVGARMTPASGYTYYWQLHRYLEEKLGRNIVLVDRKSYTEVSDLLKNGEVDVAFVCSALYVAGHDQYDLDLLVAPQVRGEAMYHSDIIVNADSPIADLEGLRGKKFAFTDPMSNTGRLAPAYMLGQMGETSESFFGAIIYTHAHDSSIRAVADGVVDGAAVDSLMWEYMSAKEPEVAGRTRVVARSESYAVPPVAVRPGLEPEIREELRAALLGAYEDPIGRGILAGMMIDRFVELEDSAYESVRGLMLWHDGSEGVTRVAGKL